MVIKVGTMGVVNGPGVIFTSGKSFHKSFIGVCLSDNYGFT